MNFIRDQWHRHLRFYVATACGVVAWFAAPQSSILLRLSIAGNVFFVVYLILVTILAFRTKPSHLRALAKSEDEGIALVVLITFAVIGVSIASVFAILNDGNRPDALHLALTIASAPLGWLMMHMVAAFHYAHRYYLAGGSGLQFSDTDEPGIWDFLYHAFVIGMTSQVSDVQVVSTRMRQLVLGHSLASFFYNTVLIALAVNVVVVLASG